jgi:DNA-binding GntR family transcriptional regulator
MNHKQESGVATTFVPAVMEARQALRHQVVRRLLLEIFRGTLPAGTRLITHKLSEQLGISATPLREALVELEAIGMVDISHNRGAVVAPFGPTELRGIYQVRRVLESEAARCACGRLDRGVLEAFQDEMREYVARGSKSAAWLKAVMASDARFHAAIAAACGSPRLAREIDRYALLMQTVSEAIGNRSHSKEDGVQEHLAIVEALLAEDPERSAAAMARHIEATAGRALGVMFSTSRPGP